MFVNKTGAGRVGNLGVVVQLHIVHDPSLARGDSVRSVPSVSRVSEEVVVSRMAKTGLTFETTVAGSLISTIVRTR